MSLSGCARDLAMGGTASFAGWIVTQEPSGQLVHFQWLGWLAVAAGLVSVWLASRVRVHESDSPLAASATPNTPSRLGARDLRLSTLNAQPSTEYETSH